MTHPPVARSVELLAPAGDWDCLRAAVENGADAVYFGLDCGFNARARATNFAVDELPAIMAFLHGRGVRGYVTLNTLVFPEELAEAERLVRVIAAAGVDALLVQDLGLARLVKGVCPELEIHASTQMTMTSAETIAAARAVGIERVVLARELSIDEIEQIHRGSDVELEAFVHGALCVAYSGQCLTSESLGGRSANRGQCAQACRLPYELLCDGSEVDLGDVQYLLSPQDLAAYELLPRMLAAGVRSFKIEGRLKTPEYVANITRHYRQALDAAVAGTKIEFTPRQVEEMELSFSRGFSPGWLEGNNHKLLVPGLSSAKRGVRLGEVVEAGRGRVRVKLAAEVKPGDGVMFDCGGEEKDRQGGRVYEMFCGRDRVTEPVAEGMVELAFAHGSLDFARILPGQIIWKTDDPELNRRLRKSFTNEQPQRRMGVDLSVMARVGEPLVVSARTTSGVECEVRSEGTLEAARKHPLSVEVLREQFGRLGGTNYELRELTATIDGGPMAPLSVLGQLRHAIVERLDVAAALPPTRSIAAASVRDRLREWGLSQAAAESHPRGDEATSLFVLVRSLDQLDAVLAASVRTVYADFADIREYGEAVVRARRAGAAIWLATPRIQKPDEMGLFRVLLRHGSDGILARNLAGLRFFADRGLPVVADFSLNAANELTTAWLREQGARRVTASYDLNREQLMQLVAAVPNDWLEVVIHQHMPMFHMEHCVFCAVLSPGTNKTNCGRPCDTHVVRLRDRVGMEHLLTADVGCRNTLYNAVPQSAAEAVPTLLSRGVRNYRVELLDEPADEITRTIKLYRELLAGRAAGEEVWRQLRAANRVGVTRGTMEERRNPLAII